MSNTDVAAIAQQFTDNFTKKFGTDYTDAVSFILPNLPFGCSWGMQAGKSLTRAQREELDKWVQTLPEKGVYVYKLSNGYLFYTDFNTLVGNIQQEVPLFNQRNLAEATAARQLAMEKFSKHLEKAAKAKTPTLTVGSFCTNDSSTVTIQGQVFKGYNIDLVTMAAMASQYGYQMVVKGTRVDPDNLANNVPQAMMLLELAPSCNAIMVQFSR